MAPTTCHKRRQWLPLACLLLCALFAALGGWQLQRLQWKQGLIDRVARNAQGPLLPIQAAPDLSGFSAEDEYRRIQFAGWADCERARAVWAATALGTGYWWMLPVRLADGGWLWVNAGYVSPAFLRQARAAADGEAPPADWAAGHCGRVEVSGLLRMSQTGGGLFRPNRPEAGRWYSRDVGALSADAGLTTGVGRWFVDAQGIVSSSGIPRSQGAVDGVSPTPDPSRRPVPGLTPLQWSNRHLGYALTWFTLALMAALGAGLSSVRIRRIVFKFRFQP